MISKVSFLLLLLTSLGVHAEWKQKAWQCEAKVANVKVGEVSSWSEAYSKTPAHVFYENLWSAIQEVFEELDKNLKTSSVCQHYKILYSPHYDSSESIPSSHGVWFKVGEELHEFWMPLNWSQYHQKIKNILVNPKYEDGEYRVCNYVCSHSRVDPSDKSLRFIAH